MKTYTVLLVDSHNLFRAGLKAIIEQSEGYKVVGETHDGLRVLEMIEKSRPDLVILEIESSQIRGLETIRKIKTHHPKIKILILTMCRNREIVYHVYHSRIDGYLLKDDSEQELFSAIEKVCSGGFYLSPLLAEELTGDFINACCNGGKTNDELLSAREIEVIKLVSDGKSAKEIAENLFISSRTVDHHRAKIMRKLNVRKNVDLVKFAIKKGYVAVNQ